MDKKKKQSQTMAQLLISLEEKINKKLDLFNDLAKVAKELADNEESTLLISKIYEVMQVIAIELEPVEPLIRFQHKELGILFDELKKQPIKEDKENNE